ncbi:MAG: hypothetical protein LLG01_03470 [Planctomycetaceae bacterium]|nr:hypothetical protein [Planctomycetaceae bacterium]
MPVTRREIVIEALEFRRPPYVPWSWDATHDCGVKLRAHLGVDDLWHWLAPHMVIGGAAIAGRSGEIRPGYWRDAFGVVWDKTIDVDIGTPCDWPLKSPQDLARYEWPNADDPRAYEHLGPFLTWARGQGLFALFNIGFSLYERAWTMRGMEPLLMDMLERPQFVHELLDAIADENLRQIRHALRHDFDAFLFGDDYGMQRGLIMGIDHWRTFIKPRLARMWAPIRAAGKYIFLHSCGRVDSLFDDLIEIGLNCFNPFQPEVMDCPTLLRKYRGRLAFHGGMSVQKVLPFGTADEVRAATSRLLAAGAQGGLIFSPSHAVPRDTPPENLTAMQAVLKAQPGFSNETAR